MSTLSNLINILNLPKTECNNYIYYEVFSKKLSDFKIGDKIYFYKDEELLFSKQIYYYRTEVIDIDERYLYVKYMLLNSPYTNNVFLLDLDKKEHKYIDYAITGVTKFDHIFKYLKINNNNLE